MQYSFYWLESRRVFNFLKIHKQKCFYLVVWAAFFLNKAAEEFREKKIREERNEGKIREDILCCENTFVLRYVFKAVPKFFHFDSKAFEKMFSSKLFPIVSNLKYYIT